MCVGPISPEKARRQHSTKYIPKEVYEAVNEILVERYSNSDITVHQNEVLSRAIEKWQSDGTSIPLEDFFTNHWLDFEPAYEIAGWKVCRKESADNKTFWVFRANRG